MMMIDEQQAAARDGSRQPEEADGQMVKVLCRFAREEVDEMKRLTGSGKNATAVACICRKNLASAK